MELKLVNGDYLPDGRGGLQQAEEEILQRALSRLTARRGSFPFLPEFGSRLYLLGAVAPLARETAAERYVTEALAPETALRVEHPDKGVDVQGDFSAVMFDHEMLSETDYYAASLYEAVLCGNRPLTRITNLQNPDGPRVLLIHDSYSTVVAPYLSLLCSRLDMIDVRQANGNFDGSLDAYRDELQPDIVIVMFCSPVNIDRSGG